MRKILFILFNLSVSCLYSQGISVDYQFQFIENDENLQSKLIIQNDSISTYEIFDINDNESVKEVNSGRAAKLIYKLPVNKNRIILKNKRKGDIYYYRLDIDKHKEYIKIVEKLHSIDWELYKDSKRILDYKCFKAVGLYKGKKYIAWYAKEIYHSDGPWKFEGLPGLILEIESEDKKLSISAYNITLKPKSKFTKNPLTFKEQYSWEEYVTKIKSFLKRLEKYTISSSKNDVQAVIKFEEPDYTIQND